MVKTWMLPWLPPLGMVVTVVLFAVLGTYVALAVIGLGVLVLVPVLWRVRFPVGEDADVKYWRFGPR
jgi:hypothetical protein